MIDDIGFFLENQRAISDCEKHYLSDEYEDHYDGDPEEDYPYDTTDEYYD